MKNNKDNVKQFCIQHGLTEDRFYGKEKIGGSLYLQSVTSIPEGFNPTVGGSLDLQSVTSIPEGFNPTVGGSLYLRSVTSIPEGFNPTVGGYLDLQSVTSIPEGFNPTVGGYLYLQSVTSIPEGFNPTVGGDLYLRSVTSIPEGFNPTVGGSLYLNSVTKYIGADVPRVDIDIPKEFSWQDGKYMKIDGIFTEILSRKKNVLKVSYVGKNKEGFLVTDGRGKWAHGNSIKEAKEDLIYKIGDRDKSAYKGLKLQSKLSHVDAIECYRIITGACSAGTKSFVENILNGKKKDRYTIAEIIKLTDGRYGNDSFKLFFEKNK